MNDTIRPDEDELFDDPDAIEEEDLDLEEEEGAADEPRPSAILTPAAKIEKLEGDLATMKDQMLRLAAELENTRRRADREKADSAKYAIANFARDLLAVTDIFERAIATAPSNPDETTPEAVSALVDGVVMTEKELVKVLERNGVTRVNPKGEKFDPNLHQAIAQVPGNGQPKDVVIDVAQPGFTIGDRVLRAAMVTVSNGA